MKGFPDLPPIWFAAMAGLSWAFSRWVPLLSFEISIWLARVPMALGLALIFWSAYWFWSKKTPIEPHHTPKALIVEGPYRVSRNPIYLGLLLILIGWALSQGGLTGFLPVVAFPFIISARFIAGEEAGLREVFGEEAEAYMARTSRWVGPV